MATLVVKKLALVLAISLSIIVAHISFISIIALAITNLIIVFSLKTLVFITNTPLPFD